MKTKLILTLFIIFTLTLVGSSRGAAQGEVSAAALGTAITYQGRLNDSGLPANAAYDFQFSLHNAESGGAQVGSPVLKNDVPVSDGYFTVLLDFGAGAFMNEARWLEVGVRPGASAGAYTVLSPRQALTAAPFALYAPNAGSVPWSGLSGVPAGFVDGVDNDTTTFWSLTGNAGTNPSGNYLGTSDNQAFEIRVNGLRALRIIPAASANLVGGYSGNSVTTGVAGATISGGGSSSDFSTNYVTDSWGTVGGGAGNTAGNSTGTLVDASFATVSGGNLNAASGLAANVGGGWGNNVSGSWATIGGGIVNYATGESATIAGGDANTASGKASTVSGGEVNQAQAAYATISGGGPSDPYNTSNTNNRVYDDYGTIGGGGYNRAGSDNGDTTTDTYATIAGGWKNIASFWEATVGGGGENQAINYNATVCGGSTNTASGDKAAVVGGVYNIASGGVAFVGGGATNTASGRRSAISGGYWNQARAAYATISGGGPLDELYPETTNNRVYDDYGTIGGGANNRVGSDDGNTATAPFGTVGGGRINQVTNQAATVGGGWVNTASGNAATVPGGANNEASGAYSFAAGADGHATHDGSFVWSSGSRTDSWGAQTFTVRAPGGVRIYTASGTATGVQIAAGGGSFASLSDQNAKFNFSPVNSSQVLEKVAALPLSTWSYRSQDASILHMGPMAQDFSAAFGLGEDAHYIGTLDADGVAMAAIQGLYRLNQQQAAEIQSLKAQLSQMDTPVNLHTTSSLPLTWVVIGLLGISQGGMFLVLLRRMRGRR